MPKSSDKVKETSAEKTSASVAGEKWDRYYKVYRPFENKLIGDITNVEPKRARAMGVAGASTEQAFSRAGEGMEKRLAAGRVAPGGGRFANAEGTLALNRAKSKGLGLNDAADLTERQAIAGKESLINIGQGKSAAAVRGFGEAANRAEAQAEADARAASLDRASAASAIGSLAGMGLDLYDNYDAGVGGPSSRGRDPAMLPKSAPAVTQSTANGIS